MKRSLHETERKQMASLAGVESLALTCEGDTGHGPCGTYLDWADGHCARGHAIEVEAETSDDDGTEHDAQQIADRVLSGRGPSSWRDAGYESARDAAAALVGDGESAAVRERAIEIVAEAIEGDEPGTTRT